jgi:hypothetical protein
MAHCKLCNTNFSVNAGALYDVKRHAKRSTHVTAVEASSKTVKWSTSEKGKLCSATKLLNNVSDNITLDDFLSTKLVILLVFEDASTAVT